MPNVTLHPHQLKALERIRPNRGHYLGDEPGCGKTIVALDVVCTSGQLTVITVPAYLKQNWLRECERFYPEVKAQIFTRDFVLDKATKIIILSYEMLPKCQKFFRTAQFYIFDEAHLASNPRTLRAKKISEYVARYKPRQLLLMSGTIIKNRIPDLYMPLKLLDVVNDCGFREHYPNFISFCRRFTHEKLVKTGGFIRKEYLGIQNEDELRRWLKPFYSRNKLSDIAELPPMVLQTIELEGGTSLLDKELKAEWDKYRDGDYIGDDYGGDEDELVGEHISSAKARSALEKAPAVASFATDLLACFAGPLVIFSDHRASAADICSRLRGAGHTAELIMGGMSDKHRDAVCQRFQAGELDAVVGTLGAMSTGLTLTRAATALVCDRSWSPSVNVQAVKRIHRISQTNKCRVYYFVRGKIDEAIAKNLAEKERISSQALEGM